MVANQAGTTVWRWDNTEPFSNSMPNDDPDGDVGSGVLTTTPVLAGVVLLAAHSTLCATTNVNTELRWRYATNSSIDTDDPDRLAPH